MPSPSFASQSNSQNQSVLETNRNYTNRSVNPNKVSVDINLKGSAFQNAAVIFQKIESTTQKVTGEIIENQKLVKDINNQKRDLMKHIETLKVQVQKAEKDNLKIKDKLPNYEEATHQMSSRMFHKRGKSNESLKEITILKQQIKQIEEEKEQFIQQKAQFRSSMKIEEIRYNSMLKQISEIKALQMQNLKEKEKLTAEISKQSKIIKNYQARKKTLNEYNVRYFDNFQHTTSKMLGEKDLNSKSKILN